MLTKDEIAFLENLALQIKSQDNRGTSHPLCEVRDVKLIYGLSPDYTEKFHWVEDGADEVVSDPKTIEALDKLALKSGSSDSVFDGPSYRRYHAGLGWTIWKESETGVLVEDAELLDTLNTRFFEDEDNLVQLGTKFSRVGYKSVSETIETFFTIQAAEEYIKCNRHNLKEPFTYVVSAWRNPEMALLRKLLSGDIVAELLANAELSEAF